MINSTEGKGPRKNSLVREIRNIKVRYIEVPLYIFVHIIYQIVGNSNSIFFFDLKFF